MANCIDCGKPVSASHVKRCKACWGQSRRGIPHTKEHRDKIAMALAAREQSPEERQQCLDNLSKAWKTPRKPISNDTRERLSIAAKKREQTHIEALHAANVANGRYHPLGATMINNKGYVEQKVQHFHGNRNWRAQHRIIMEEHLGRKLSPAEWIHHIDGDKTNNSLDNLALISKKEHYVLNHVLAKINLNPTFADIVIRTIMTRSQDRDL